MRYGPHRPQPEDRHALGACEANGKREPIVLVPRSALGYRKGKRVGCAWRKLSAMASCRKQLSAQRTTRSIRMASWQISHADAQAKAREWFETARENAGTIVGLGSPPHTSVPGFSVPY